MIRKLRETINLFIYDSKESVLRVLSVLHLVVSLVSVGTLVYYYGFHIDKQTARSLFNVIEISFGFYILRYVIKVFYDFNPIQFIRNSWVEAVLLVLLAAEGVTHNIFGLQLIAPVFNSIGLFNFEDVSTVFIQLFFFSYILADVYKRSRRKLWARLHPALLFMISIAGLILIGAALLMLPEMSYISGGMEFVDALFMSASSVSVTGLTTFDVSADLTFKGQAVVLFLIKVGGLNTIAFGALLFLVARFGVGVKQHEVIEDFVNKQSLQNAGNIFRKIIIWATCIEVAGIVALYFLFEPSGIFAEERNRLWHAIFHGISGFNNAGISTIPGGYMHPELVNNYLVHIVTLALFFLGGFGMIYLFDLFEIKKLRERMAKPWKTIEFGTKISLYFTIVLLLVGAVFLLIFEWNGVFKEDGTHGSIIKALFHSMTTRNAGFSSIDISALSIPVFIIFLFLMFVGSSSGSTGGGIRTSTFAIMWASVISTIRGRKHTELFKRTIDNNLVLKAFSITMFFVVGNLVGILALSITEAEALRIGAMSFTDIVFEHVSASCTVGLSTGITADLSSAGKVVIVLAMFVGRVGTLTVAYLFIRRSISKNYRYPTGHTMVG